MGLPGMVDLTGDLAYLQEQGVEAVVSLTEIPLDEVALEDVGMAFLHLPTLDMTPPTQGDIGRFIWFAGARISEGRPVAVHCLAGRGRTGTMLACFLVHRGMPAQAAIDEIRQLRPGSIETLEQEEAVRAYARVSEKP